MDVPSAGSTLPSFGDLQAHMTPMLRELSFLSQFIAHLRMAVACKAISISWEGAVVTVAEPLFDVYRAVQVACIPANFIQISFARPHIIASVL